MKRSFWKGLLLQIFFLTIYLPFGLAQDIERQQTWLQLKNSPSIYHESGRQEEMANHSITKEEQEYLEFRGKLLDRYQTKVANINLAEQQYVPVFSPEDNLTSGFDSNFTVWWRDLVTEPVNKAQSPVTSDISTLFNEAITHSSQIKVFADLPLIRQTSIQEAQGLFDFRFFAEGRYRDLDEPVGDELKTGGPLRYEEDSRALEYGIKKNFLTGTEVELKQRIGDYDNNSIYLNPEEQARTGTFLSFRQPLLKRFGIDYNEAPKNLAKIDFSIAKDELQRQVESHLLEVARAYWSLYLERTLFLQKKDLTEKTNKILKQMQDRTEIDINPGLLARATSLAKAHELGTIQAEYAMRNAQSRIRALVNAPMLLAEPGTELITSQRPLLGFLDLPSNELLTTALVNRAEIAQGVRQIQAAVIREARAKNELRPDLDLFFETYVKGLEGDYDYSQAYNNQFDEGDPSYAIGLRFEYPFGNNSARARSTRKQIEIRQLMHQLDTTVENVLLEVQISYREMKKYYDSMLQSYRIMEADRQEIKELRERIDYLLAQGDEYGGMLYRLMDASERLTESEEVFARSELTYNLAVYNLYRAMGTLVSQNSIVFLCDDDGKEIPSLRACQPDTP